MTGKKWANITGRSFIQIQTGMQTRYMERAGYGNDGVHVGGDMCFSVDDSA